MNIFELPVISVVTPSFNQAGYLEECIDSVLCQGYPRLEYVIMDGGSTDGSVEIIKKYEKYLKYWQSCPDGGQYQAVNEGFRHTTGEIMAWLNSDDKYHPLAFAKVACTFTDYPDVKWLTGRKSFWDASGNLLKIEETLPVFSRKKILLGHANKPYIQQESTFWRRSLWEKAGAILHTEVDLAGDLELWCRFFRTACLHTIDTLLGGYRFHDGQRGVVEAEKYRQQANFCAMREQRCCTILHDQLPPPPAPLSIGRDRLASFVAMSGIQLMPLNHFRCWCEYAEDLLIIMKALLHERRIEQALFWQREISVLSLAKPRLTVLLATTLEKLLAEWENTKNSVDLMEYQDVNKLAPYWGHANAMVLRNLQSTGNRAKTLEALSVILARHAHDSNVVRVAISLLYDYGAIEQALGVCEEYLSVDPHDDEILAFRESLLSILAV